ncbi:hypothetical protein PR202_ga30926 [Eleusine coracana subsp. coracana]|uniref:DDHD domain-containing protein n=1 Tax=Eleusine coracana subsp. coracana TaxID=191504 RepID=A0AAV5DQE0_ELECO|nr:hypothetical protein PR202_ga30926 [Eleusine coracana subsp. coracana]
MASSDGGPADAPASTSGAVSTSYAAAGASPDSLQNTPSNIARLEDAIENCAARRKYLARTKSPSDGEDVRWYFCKLPLGDRDVTETEKLVADNRLATDLESSKVLSSSVPRTEIVGKGDYFRFSMRDCLALEASFLEREEELLAYWWREYAQCSDGPRGSLVKDDDDSDSEDLYKVEEERVGVPVKGGLYEVDLMRRHCFPVYWNGENRRVLRGHWFARKGGVDWIPLREDVSEQLELAYNCQVWHRRKFQPSGLFAARVDLQGSTPDLHALFTGEDDTWEAWLVFDTGPKLGSNTIKLRRGFSSSESAKPSQDELRQQKEEEMDDYCSQVPVRHLVFMVHGIGQRLEKANLVDDVVDFRRWRKSLKLKGEHTVEKITLDGVKDGIADEGNRSDPSHTDDIHASCMLENAPDNDKTPASPVAVDEEQKEVKSKDEGHQITYTEEGAMTSERTKDAYVSSISRSVEEAHEQVKRLKTRLVELEQQNDLVTENVGYHEGKDANHIRNLSLGICMGQGSTIHSYTPQIRYTKLNFKVDTFFAVGSPLGGLLYRIEPLVCEDYINKRPVIVPYHRGGKRIHVGVQEFTEDVAARSRAIGRQLKSLKVKAVAALLALSRNDAEEDSESTEEKGRSYGSMMMERLTGSPDGRIDHVLQEKTFQHPYLSALGAHTNYWRDHDTALFILKHLYRDIPEEPPADETERGVLQKGENLLKKSGE